MIHSGPCSLLTRFEVLLLFLCKGPDLANYSGMGVNNFCSESA